MYLFIKTPYTHFYEKHTSAYNGDSGIDLFFPHDVEVGPKQTVLVDLGVCCEMKKTDLSVDDRNYSYYLYPRSSIYKTPLRLSNSVGIIDAGYRNSIKVAVDNISDKIYTIKSGTRLFQICSATLEPIIIKLTGELSMTERGEGFGSSGV